MTALAGSGISLAGELEPVLADLVGKRTHKEA